MLNKNKYLLDPEMDRLVYLLRSHMDKETRPCCLLLLALYTGARATELLNLRVEDINEYEATLFIRGIKGSNDREIPLADWIFELVVKVKSLAMADQRNQSKGSASRLFPFTYNRLRQIWQLYRPVDKKFHALRHTFAIRLYKKTKDLRLLQVALGHRNITNTMIYADYVYSQQELRKLIL